MEATHMTSTTLIAAKNEVTRLWNLMCANDNIPYDSKFVLFNCDNPVTKPYNKAVQKYMRMRQRATPEQLRRLYVSILAARS
jgi:hypothetical protein